MNALPAAHRPAAIALAASAALHGALMAGFGVSLDGDSAPGLEPVAYTATLAPAPPAAEATPAPASPAAAKPRARPRPRNEPRPGETVARLPDPEPAAAAVPDAAPPEPAPSEAPAPAEAPPPPEVLALAQPAVPAPALEPEDPLAQFRADALPSKLTIHYALTSPLVEGEAEYTWQRDGDRYEISGTAEASGFFTLFLEGRITQESSGLVTPRGLRPERFAERRGDTPEEGLAFDWQARTVEFRRGRVQRTGELTDNTVDWLSMIFQLAHLPPARDGTALRVFTQRRLHEYRLQVVGEESIELPFGTARTLHLRHEGKRPEDAVDVWLGLDHHNLPVKLRYPVARGRLVVEQTATSISGSVR